MEEMSEQTIQRVADNVSLQLIARGGVILWTVVALPLGIWAGGRLIETVDKLAVDVAALKTDFAVMRADLANVGDDVDDLKDDHDPKPFGGR